ncbi:hypothetical protein DRE_04400 [Drechslerella stenobrocha 248]|uniref:AB hydrolase-1 domain-containing protein n=1 Tax=Drechslerella stenobrocha 248 TaxID=1043628 RepID=W7I1U7_9PEZI|nr:hypothetical protein DRE_04400 [Drechslerella stenobrocha 248]
MSHFRTRGGYSRPASTFAALSTARPTESQTFHLPDGRMLGYAEYGHPTGYPVITFHGFPSSRVEAYPLDRIAQLQGLRILSLERPGFGLSTFQPQRRILDWPADVEAFARHKGLRRFAIIGVSGGGPYALACAKALPNQMMLSVGLFASGPPWVAGRQHMPWFARWPQWLVNFWPGGYRLLAGALVGTVNWLIRTRFVTRRIDKFLEASARKAKEEPSPEADLELVGAEDFTTEQRRERLLSLVWNEPFAQGTAGFILETKLLSDPTWGFEFEDVEYGPIRIWHGAQDSNAPIQMIRYMAERLPNAVLTEFEDTHFTMARNFSRALSELVSEQEKLKYREAQLQTEPGELSS